MRFSKYKAVKTIVDGFTFASKLEAKYYQIYSAMENAGVIKNLKMQTSLPFIFEGKKIFTYKPDFEYDDSDGVHHYIDVKSPITAKNQLFRLKRKLIESYYKIEIEIVM